MIIMIIVMIMRIVLMMIMIMIVPVMIYVFIHICIDIQTFTNYLRKIPLWITCVCRKFEQEGDIELAVELVQKSKGNLLKKDFDWNMFFFLFSFLFLHFYICFYSLIFRIDKMSSLGTSSFRKSYRCNTYVRTLSGQRCPRRLSL